MYLLNNFGPKIKFLAMSYYAVAKGRNPGIYKTWDECKAEVNKYSGAVYKKFTTISEAKSFIIERQSSLQSSRNYSKQKINPYYLPKKSSSVTWPETSAKKTFEPNCPKDDSLVLNNFSLDSTTKRIFQRDSDGRVDIYTDGACLSNGCDNAKAGLGVYFGDNHPANVAKPVHGRATNNNAEIQAVIEAAKIAQRNGLLKIRINTDSEFLINCMTKWIKKWKAKGWKTANNHSVINKEELEEMERALAPLDVEFNHVRGHVGIHGNEMADKLARDGANM
ncbi:hypothetical protein PV327_010613 [Microctonus hyperodae]|uniref:Ribonuclease H1 n=1 Tax=Microctonus hyperodae TaxID=165561 RepID=A0AA39FSN5_MICHY|nr:hypothetical protein PV327_010613 [Microctonus hyperodae]